MSSNQTRTGLNKVTPKVRHTYPNLTGNAHFCRVIYSKVLSH